MSGSRSISRPNVMTEGDMTAGRLRMMKLSELKDIVLNPHVEEQVDPVAPAASFLLTWTSHTPEEMKQKYGGIPGSTVHYGHQNWLRSTVTIHDGADIRHPLSLPGSMFKRPEDLLPIAQQEIVYSLLEMYYDLTRTASNKWMRIPVEIRVRDIVHYRMFRSEFEKIDPEKKTGMKVRCDNVMGFNRPENTNFKLYAFCGSCLKVGSDHQRCSGCKIAHYCSTPCQKKDWARHKLECKECQLQQEEWNEKLIGYGYERL